MKRKSFLIIGIIAVFLIAFCGLLVYTGYQKFMSVDAVEYDPELEILLGGGGNSIILTSEDGLQSLVVDTKMGSAAKRMRERVKAKEIIVINTHFHADHISGNGLYTGAKIIAGAYTKEQWMAAAPKERYPDETVAPGEEKLLRIGGETVHVRNMGRAHTSNDVVVYLEKRKLLVTGDIVLLNKHPVLFAQSGCSVAAWISALDSLAPLYDIKTLVPGHGEVADKSALQTMRDYFVSIGNALDDAQKLGLLEKKYRGYASVPGMSGFGKTVQFIRNEKHTAPSR